MDWTIVVFVPGKKGTSPAAWLKQCTAIQRKSFPKSEAQLLQEVKQKQKTNINNETSIE